MIRHSIASIVILDDNNKYLGLINKIDIVAIIRSNGYEMVSDVIDCSCNGIVLALWAMSNSIEGKTWSIRSKMEIVLITSSKKYWKLLGIGWSNWIVKAMWKGWSRWLIYSSMYYKIIDCYWYIIECY